MKKPNFIYVIDFPNPKGKFGEDTIVIKANNWKEAQKVIKHYFTDWKEKLKCYRKYSTTLLEKPKN